MPSSPTPTRQRAASPIHAIALALLATMVFRPQIAHAQDQTLFKSGQHTFGGFGGPIFRVTSVAGETMALGGGGGAFLIDRKFAIGGAGFGGTQRVDARVASPDGRGEMDFGYGGLTLEVITRPSRLVHATVGVLLGGGAVSVWPDDLRPRNRDRNDDTFSVVEPQVSAELNLTRWFRMGASVAYRAAFGAETPRLVNDNLSGVSGGLVFKFGSF
jgi:hypothetical protein